MKILEVHNNKIVAEIPGKYYTRIVCRADDIPTGNLGITRIRDAWPKWPIRMNTRKYHADMRKVKEITTEQLRKEVAAVLPSPSIINRADQWNAWVKQKEMQ